MTKLTTHCLDTFSGKPAKGVKVEVYSVSSTRKKLNDAYKKFGFPFILAVKGKSKIEILNNFRKRINSEPQIEFEEAVRQVKKIANLRLHDLNSKNI